MDASRVLSGRRDSKRSESKADASQLSKSTANYESNKGQENEIYRKPRMNVREASHAGTWYSSKGKTL